MPGAVRHGIIGINIDVIKTAAEAIIEYVTFFLKSMYCFGFMSLYFFACFWLYLGLLFRWRLGVDLCF